MQIFIK